MESRQYVLERKIKELKDEANLYNRIIVGLKSEIQGKPIDIHRFYDARTSRWDDSKYNYELSLDQHNYAYILFYREALKEVEHYIKIYKGQLKNYQRAVSKTKLNKKK